VAGSTEDAALDAVEEAVGARLVQESAGTVDRFAFAHAIIRNVIYRELPTSRRVRIHWRVGEALERLGGDPKARLVQMAHHYLEGASAGRADTAAKYAAAAAAEAEASLAFDDACDLCERGLAALAASDPDAATLPGPESFELLFRLGRAQLLAGRRGGRETLLGAFEMAEAFDDPDRMASAVLSISRGFFSRMGRTDVQLVDAIERALAARPPGDDAVTAELLATLASELVWAEDGERRFELSDQALTMARKLDDPRTLARILLLRQFTISAPDTLAVRTVERLELLKIAAELQDPGLEFQAASQGAAALQSGDVASVTDEVDLAMKLAGELHQPNLVWQANVNLTSRRILEGDLDDAEQHAFETLELGRQADHASEARIFFTEHILEIRRWQDRLGEMLPDFQAAAGVDGIDFGYTLIPYLYDAGEEDAAAARYKAIVPRLRLPPRRDMLAASTLGNLAYLATRVGDAERARAIYEVLLPFADAFVTTTIIKPVGLHYLGMLASTMGEADVADDHFAAALEAHEQLGVPLLIGETQLEWARLLIERDAERAARLLDAVRSTASTYGARFLERGCEQLSVPSDGA
jgi:tetratricopeptide (TPR) repeat protein